MIIRMFAFAGKLMLWLATLAFITATSLFVVGAFLATWPIMRVNPRGRRIQATMGAAVAIVECARAFGLDKLPTPATGATGDTENSRGEVN